MSCKFPKFRESAGCVVACQQCTPCLLKAQREKVSRVLLEDRAGLGDPLFVCLTYDDAHLPFKYSEDVLNRVIIKRRFRGADRQSKLDDLRREDRWDSRSTINYFSPTDRDWETDA